MYRPYFDISINATFKEIDKQNNQEQFPQGQYIDLDSQNTEYFRKDYKIRTNE